jgi:ketosteroid isomerase-like protein
MLLCVISSGESFAQDINPSNQELDIKRVLTIQVQSWNQGDLNGFMSTYWKSKKLSFSSGGNTTFGWQATFQRYKKNYSPPKEMGKLKFSKLLVTPIEENSALVLGNWHLTLEDKTNPHGNFSLVLKKFDGDWKIVHDHTSTLKEQPKIPSASELGETAPSS